MNLDFCVYPLLTIASGRYALALDANKQRTTHNIEPDWIWVEVTLGVAPCLLAVTLRMHLEPDQDGQRYEQVAWKAFVVGGFPIVIWQLWRAADHQRRLGAPLHPDRKRHHGNAP